MKRVRSILHVEHNWGGGVSRHVNDLSKWLQREGIRSFRATPDQTQGAINIKPVTSNPFDMRDLVLHKDRFDDAVRIASDLEIDHIHIHSLVNYEGFFEFIIKIGKSLNIQYDITLHDYSAICPRLHMIDVGKTYCNSLSEKYCDKCISFGGDRMSGVKIADWRYNYDMILSRARKIFVPNPDVEQRMRLYALREYKYTLRPHPEHCVEAPSLARNAVGGRSQTVGIVGPLVTHKGAHIVRLMAQDAADRRLDIRFVVFGGTNLEDFYSMKRVTILGRYVEEEIDELINKEQPAVMLFPSVCPETFSYGLSISFRNKIFPVCFDIGAIARRIRDAKFGLVVPTSLMFRPQELNDILCEQMERVSEDVGCSSWMTPWTGAGNYYDMRF